jgi:DNA-binding XRE family transcriptional regulator
MNQRTLKKKLELSKQTVVNLNYEAMEEIVGGETVYTVCGFFCMTNTELYPPTAWEVCATCMPCGTGMSGEAC